MIVIIIAVVIRLVDATTLLSGVRVIRRPVPVDPSGIDTQQEESQKLK